jgi:hypothetical protein
VISYLNLEGIYSTTKVSLKVEVCTIIIKVIYVISLANVKLLGLEEKKKEG